MRTLKQCLKDRKLFKRFTLYFDIETFQYNEKAGKVKPSKYKNNVYSLAVSWIEDGNVEFEIFPTFKEFFDVIIHEYASLKKPPKIFLNAHNTNKYDNHFLRSDLIYYYQTPVENYYLNTATTDESNKDSLKLNQLTKKNKEKIILEKRIKSSINLELIFFLEGIQFETVDNWIKTNSSIAMLGKKLQRLNLVTEEELKTDFNYTKYNLDEDLTIEEAKNHALYVFNQLSTEELRYIKNDVILLAKSAYHYSELFNGFDYSKRTFTSNILESYNTNDLTSFQLLNRIGKGKGKKEIRYTDYKFAHSNFYDYLKPFYRGGLNFYNQYHIGKIIKDGVFGMDINSSYPYAMHQFKIPTYLKSYEVFEKPSIVSIHTSEDEYSLYQLSKEDFDRIILDKIDSVIIKQILVKYYSTNEFININSYTFKMIENITGLTFKEIPVYSTVTFETKFFGSREQINQFYQTKTKGSHENKLIYQSPYQILETNEKNDTILSREEIDNSKVNLNGLYGIPALRPYFNLFRKNKNNEYYNIENGHKNAERNIVFSIFVTSVSLWNLLSPFKYLTQNEVDENFIYCDTDSLYFKKAIQDKIPDELFDPYILGKWDLEHDHLKNFYVLNHKKYCYTDENEKINIRAGGIPKDSFNIDMTFEKFVQTQFSEGVEIPTIKSIYNETETISIYPSMTKLELGTGYRIQTVNKLYLEMKEIIKKQVKENIDKFTDDVLYIESDIGTFSLADFFPLTHETKNKKDLVFLQISQSKIKNDIENN